MKSTVQSASEEEAAAGLRQRSAAETQSNGKKKTADKERLVNSVSDVTDGMMELSRKLNMQVPGGPSDLLECSLISMR